MNKVTSTDKKKKQNAVLIFLLVFFVCIFLLFILMVFLWFHHRPETNKPPAPFYFHLFRPDFSAKPPVPFAATFFRNPAPAPAFKAGSSASSPHPITHKPIQEVDSFLKEGILLNALQRFYQTYGFFPSSLKTLVQPYPDNYLSVIPQDVHYHSSHHTFSLSFSGGSTYTPATAKAHRFELRFYTATNEVGLVYQNQNLALFPAAFGISALPPSPSVVTLRTVKPNGGKSPLGTRGLVLEEGFAIHGTNDPSSIGSPVTAGCLRLHNETIERLFPYVSIGTPFYVDDSPAPPVALYASLPAIEKNDAFTDGDHSSNEQSSETFEWKN